MTTLERMASKYPKLYLSALGLLVMCSGAVVELIVPMPV